MCLQIYTLIIKIYFINKNKFKRTIYTQTSEQEADLKNRLTEKDKDRKM